MKRMFCLLIVIATVVIMTNIDTGYTIPAGEGKKEILEKASGIQIPFIANEGQIQNESVRFYARTFGGTLNVTKEGELVYFLPVKGSVSGNGGSESKKWIVLKERIVGGKSSEVKGEEESPTRMSTFKGNDPSKWKSNIQTYGTVSLGEVYDGIELKLKAYGKKVEKLFYLKPDAKAEEIKVRFDGVKGLSVNKDGELEVSTELGVVKFTKPVAYQVINGKRVDVVANYIINPLPPSFTPLESLGIYAGDAINRKHQFLIEGGVKAPPFLTGFTKGGQGGFNSELPSLALRSGVGQTPNSDLIYGFKVGDYNKNYPLIIDPLLASTFIGGDSSDVAQAIALDPSGNIYITGYTNGSGSTPPVNFPTTSGAYQEKFNEGGETDIFISKFNATLTTLLASTCLGGTITCTEWSCGPNGADIPNDMKIDASGNVYIGGDTHARDFPTTEGAFDTNPSMWYSSEGFVSKLDSSLSHLLASTFINKDTFGEYSSVYSLALGSDGSVYIAGKTSGSAPVPGGYQTTSKGWGDGFVGKMDSSLSTMLAFTFIGGTGDDSVNSITLDSSGNIFLAGNTNSTDYPTTAGAYDTTHNGNWDVTVSKFDANLANLLASTYLGGSVNEYGNAIALDRSGSVFVAGTTDSSDFPTTTGAYCTTRSSGNDIFVAKLNSNLTSLLASTFIGGNWFEGINRHGLIIDSTGNIFIAGSTGSSDFPTTVGADNTTFNKGAYQYDVYDAFISKFNSTLSSLSYSTFIGGTNSDWANAIALDSSGKIVIAGYTSSSDYPTTTGAYDTTWNGGEDVFVSILEEPKTLAVDIIGPKNITPGQEGTYLIKYMNGMDWTAEDVVIQVSLPVGLNLVFPTSGVIIKGDTKEIFWKLGNVLPKGQGELILKLAAPWGAPNVTTGIAAKIGAKNSANNIIEVDSYLNYTSQQVTSRRMLSSSEIASILASNSLLKNLYDYALSLNYQFNNTGVQTTLSSGELITELIMGNTSTKEIAFVTDSDGNAFITAILGDSVKIFDKNGGYKIGTNGIEEFWGTWVGTKPQGLEKFFSSQTAPDATKYAYCLKRCMVLKGMSWGLSEYVQAWKIFTGGKNFFDCYGDPKWGSAACIKYLNNVAGIVAGSIPGVNKAADVGFCLGTCYKDPSYEGCKLPYTECGWNLAKIAARAVFSPGSKSLGYKKVWKCDTTTGEYISTFFEDEIEWCPDGQTCHDSDPAGNAVCQKPCPGEISSSTSAMTSFGHFFAAGQPSSAESMCKVCYTDIRAAHDPNAKSADFKGNVVPGQTINYTIEYENTGTGSAFEVFVTDDLDSDLDEMSLVIGNNGTYSSTSRRLSWDIGTLEPGQKGSVTFSAKVKNGLPSGTEIINYAEVHFPSAFEVTPTNPVLNIVKTIAAEPKLAETTSGTPVSITLTGHDSGSGALTYSITSTPLNGTVTGTPPSVSYTSVSEFSGQDEFYYVVNNGIIDSDPAKVTVIVDPNPEDTQPPTVISTYPTASATNVHIGNTPLSANPIQYTPTLTATFSEPIDADTVTEDSFVVDGLTGNVIYDEQTRTASFIPSMPLTYSTTYTITLTTDITDKVGNPMESEYSWQFSTESPQNIAVVLPDNANELDFGNIPVNSTSSDKVVNVMNTGTLNLSLGTIGKTGTNASDFMITDDKCSGKTLAQFQNCIVKVAFKPQSTGVKIANLSIPSNDPDTPIFNVPLRGAGVTQKYLLTVSKTGTGNGTVTSNPSGINCGLDCSETYNQGTSVILTATASSGSTFTGWSGACSGTGTCSVTMNSDKTVTATFNQQVQQYTLTVTKSGTGSGTVISSPAGINCGSDCSEAYNPGTSVTLTATTASGSTFGGWSGACSGTGGCSVTMNSDKTVTATFTLGQKPNLTPYKLQGWSDKIVVSNVTGTTTDSSPLYTTDTLYVDWAVVNNGPETMTARFYTTIYVDGVEKLSWYSDALNPNWYAYVNDYSIGSLSAGTHTIKIVADSTGVIDESNESDNEYTKTITVTNPNGPDLTGEWISVTQSCKYTSKGKSCKITGSLKIENIGNRDAPSSYVEIYVFGDIEEYLIKRFSTGKLKAGKSKTWKISYTLPAGESASGRNIYVFIDMDEEVEERDETNNLVIYTIP